MFNDETHCLGWSPADGETVHLNRRNPWDLAADRYRLQRDGRQWSLAGPADGGATRVTMMQLVGAEVAGTLTPISCAELARERQELALRTAAPLQQNRRGAMLRQHDASELALFRHADEPGLAL